MLWRRRGGAVGKKARQRKKLERLGRELGDEIDSEDKFAEKTDFGELVGDGHPVEMGASKA